eukprot:Nk52_evm23s356 gene=Nk52_evmTU23s356
MVSANQNQTSGSALETSSPTRRQSLALPSQQLQSQGGPEVNSSSSGDLSRPGSRRQSLALPQQQFLPMGGGFRGDANNSSSGDLSKVGSYGNLNPRMRQNPLSKSNMSMIGSSNGSLYQSTGSLTGMSRKAKKAKPKETAPTIPRRTEEVIVLDNVLNSEEMRFMMDEQLRQPHDSDSDESEEDKDSVESTSDIAEDVLGAESEDSDKEEIQKALFHSQGKRIEKRRPTLCANFDFIGVKYPGQVLKPKTKEDTNSKTNVTQSDLQAGGSKVGSGSSLGGGGSASSIRDLKMKPSMARQRSNDEEDVLMPLSEEGGELSSGRPTLRRRRSSTGSLINLNIKPRLEELPKADSLVNDMKSRITMQRASSGINLEANLTPQLSEETSPGSSVAGEGSDHLDLKVKEEDESSETLTRDEGHREDKPTENKEQQQQGDTRESDTEKEQNANEAASSEQRAPKSRFSLKKVSKNIALLAGQTKTVNEESKKKRQEKEANNQKKEAKSLVERFNLSYFKVRHAAAIKEPTMNSLQTIPGLRTDDDIDNLFTLVTGLRSFDKYQPSVKRELCKVVSLESFGVSRTVIRQGDPANSFYYILRGSVDVIKESPNILGGTYSHTVNELHAGDCFGELALIRKTARAATIVTREPTDFLRLEKNDFKRIVRKRMKQDIKDRHRFLAEVPVLHNLKHRELRGLAELTSPLEYKEGDVIYKSQSKSIYLYFIKSGMVKIMKEVDITDDVVLPDTNKLLNMEVQSRRRNMNSLQLSMSVAQEHGVGSRNAGATPGGRKTSYTFNTDAPTVKAKKKSVIACLRVLSRGDVFGESGLVRVLRGESAVAYGKVEVVAVSIMEFAKRMPQKTLEILMKSAEKSETEEELRSLVKVRSDWDSFKEYTIEEVIEQRRNSSRSEKDIRSFDDCGMPVFTADEILKRATHKEKHRNIFIRYSRNTTAMRRESVIPRPQTVGALGKSQCKMPLNAQMIYKEDSTSSKERPQTTPAFQLGSREFTQELFISEDDDIEVQEVIHEARPTTVVIEPKSVSPKSRRTSLPIWNSHQSAIKDIYEPMIIQKPIVKHDTVLYEIVNPRTHREQYSIHPSQWKY